MPFDLRKSNKIEDYENLYKQLLDVTKSSEISILVNNSQEYDPYGSKKALSEGKIEDEIIGTLTANTYPMVLMTRFLGPDLKKRSVGDTKSAIINMSTFYGGFSGRPGCCHHNRGGAYNPD